MKRILVVDDEEPVRASLVFGLRAGLAGCFVTAAGGGREALELLARQPVDLVVTDLRMPEMDGLELITYLRRDHPGLPVVVVSGVANAAEDAVKVGSLDCFIKPFSLDVFCRRVGEILSQTVKGRVENINLASFLQLLEIEHKTCVLRVESGGLAGQLFFRGGRLIDAVAGGLSGQEAAFEIVTWENADIEISSLAPDREAVIEASLQFLLMEAMRRKDESAASALAAQNDLAAVFEHLGSLAGLVAALVASGEGTPIATPPGLADETAETMAAAAAAVLAEESRMAARLDPVEVPEEILITGGGRYAFIRPLARPGRPFLLVLLDRSTANLALSRLQVAELAQSLACEEKTASGAPGLETLDL
ncbi:MAG TPA: response regulator [Thermoanaerobaculia bacterium]|nr:response regulator [Thermoanaerobaculia bacterium]